LQSLIVAALSALDESIGEKQLRHYLHPIETKGRLPIK